MIASLGLIVVAYLLGSFSTAVVVSKCMNLPDPRTIGSLNPGATNMLREAGKLPAFLTLFGDSLKGFIPVFLVKQLGFEYWIVGAVALAAFIGHLYPIFFNFKGGKGVATAAGVLLGMDWVLGGITLGVWLVVIAISRIAAVAAVVASLVGPFVAWKFTPYFLIPVIIISILIIWRHRVNLKNLITGVDSKIR